MGPSKGTNENRRYFNFVTNEKLIDKEHGYVIAEIKKVGNDYIKDDWFSALSGYVTRAVTDKFKWKDKTGKEREDDKFIYDLTTEEGICQLEFTCNVIAYGIINALLNADLKRPITFEGWIGKNQLVGGGVKYFGERDAVKWKVPVEELPKPKVYDSPVPGGDPIKDHTPVVEFWKEKFKDITFRAISSNYGGKSKELLALEATQSSLNQPSPLTGPKAIEKPANVQAAQGVKYDDDLQDLPF